MTQLRVGLIGAGGIAGVHIAGWQQLDAHITVYSRSGAAHLVQQYGVSEAGSLEELLAASDVVSILTPTTTHHDYALAAFAAGKDVMCEKPLAENAWRAAEMVNAAKAAGVLLFPAHVVRFFPEYVELKELLGSGPAPAVLELSRSSAAPAAGSWFFDEAMGGGIVPDQMIHDIDQALWLAGEVCEVTAVQNPPSSGGVVPRPVTARIELLHSNGARSYLNGSWGADDVPFSTSVKVAAAHGAVLYAWPKEAASDENAPGDYLPAQSAQDSPYTLQIADFAAALESGAPARVTPADGVMAVALAEAAIASIKTGKTIDFPAAKVLALLGGEGSAVEL